MTDERPPVRPEDALEVAQRALAKANRLDEHEERINRLEDELTATKLRVSEIDEERDYDELTRDDKIGMVREYLFQSAIDGRGRSLDYADVRDKVFDGEPGVQHCYTLMRLAAQAPGFRYEDPSTSNKRIVVDPDEAKLGYAFSSENKTGWEGTV